MSGIIWRALYSHHSQCTKSMTLACLTVHMGRDGELEFGGGSWSELRCQMLAAVSENSPKSLVLSIKTSITDYSHKNIPSAC